MIKDNLRAYKHLVQALFNVSRVLIFEKFTAVFFFFYLLFILSIGFILSVIHWGVGIGFVFLGLVFFLKSLQGFMFVKRALIRRGDRVEYADPTSSKIDTMFSMGQVLLKMRLDEVKKSRLVSEELMEGNRHFYLVEVDKKPKIIAYDWIISLSPEILDELED